MVQEITGKADLKYFKEVILYEKRNYSKYILFYKFCYIFKIFRNFYNVNWKINKLG